MNEALDLSEDLMQMMAERNAHAQFCTQVMESLPKGTLDFIGSPIVQRQIRIAILTGYLAGKGVDLASQDPMAGMIPPNAAEGETVDELEAKRQEREAAEQAVRDADAKAKQRPAPAKKVTKKVAKKSTTSLKRKR